MKSGVLSHWMDAHLGCPQLLSLPQKCQGVLSWLQTQLQRSATGRTCRIQPDVHLQPDVCCLWRGCLADPQGGDVRLLAAMRDTTGGAGGLGLLCKQTRHLPGTDKLVESGPRAATWLGYLPTTRFPPQKKISRDIFGSSVTQTCMQGLLTKKCVAFLGL